MMDDFDNGILNEFRELERQMCRMLRSSSLSGMMPLATREGWQPAVDVYETTEEIIVLMDTAGIDTDRLTVTAEKNSITVQGRRSLPKHGNVCCIHQLEIEMGYFKRKISFPVSVDVAETSFNCQNGILEIRMPKEVKGSPTP